MPNIFPQQEAVPISDSTQTPVKFGRSVKFDFDAGEFALSPTGKVAVTTGLDAYSEWCRKALLTPRYRYLIYSRSYGNEFEDLIGRGFPRAVAESEIKRITTETLMGDIRTREVRNFSYTWDGDVVEFTCDVISVNYDVVKTGAKVVLTG